MCKNPDYIKKQIVARNTKFMNKKEQLVFDLINSICPNEWKWVGNGEVIIGGKCPDFINNGQNKLIEFFGDYWHKNDDAVEKIELFKKFGYDTLIIWESELKNIENVKLKISNFIYTI
jgi:G:T-mismatch repair DNA endonuclease (very short patch repair protein)